MMCCYPGVLSRFRDKKYSKENKRMKIKKQNPISIVLEQTNLSEYEIFKEILSRNPEFLEKFCIENDAEEQFIDIAKNKSVKKMEAEDDDNHSKLMDNLKINLIDDGNTNFVMGNIWFIHIYINQNCLL